MVRGDRHVDRRGDRRQLERLYSPEKVTLALAVHAAIPREDVLANPDARAEGLTRELEFLVQLPSCGGLVRLPGVEPSAR